MTNIYWPVYKNIESELNRLTFDIHIDDNQLNVYSSKITDLILRAAIEIESISKDLYLTNGGTKSDNIKYDEVAIKHLNKIWKLDKKVVILSSLNCFQTNRILKPFIKSEQRTGGNRLTFSWNNAYQNLKHDRSNSLKFGSIKYLFDIMSALYILNIYYKGLAYNLEKDNKAINFQLNQGSNIFSIKLHKFTSYNHPKESYGIKSDFDEYIYLVKHRDESRNSLNQANKKLGEIILEDFLKHPKTIKYLDENKTINILKDYSLTLIPEIIGSEDYDNILRNNLHIYSDASKNVEYEAVLNKYDLTTHLSGQKNF